LVGVDAGGELHGIVFVSPFEVEDVFVFLAISDLFLFNFVQAEVVDFRLLPFFAFNLFYLF
jgi:hypothetical protein